MAKVKNTVIYTVVRECRGNEGIRKTLVSTKAYYTKEKAEAYANELKKEFKDKIYKVYIWPVVVKE